MHIDFYVSNSSVFKRWNILCHCGIQNHAKHIHAFCFMKAISRMDMWIFLRSNPYKQYISNYILSSPGEKPFPYHYSDVIMGVMASQITSLTIVHSTVYSDADQRKHQSSASLAFVRGIHQGPVNSPHKWPVTRKMFPFDDVIMTEMAY